MCEYCDKRVKNKKIKDVDNDKEDAIYVCRLGEKQNMLNVELDAVDNDGYKASDFFKINYCPMCGRKLGEE